jgi:septum formation protein
MLFLASTSQSRQLLLKQAGFTFQSIPTGYQDEVIDPHLSHEKAIEKIAFNKLSQAIIPQTPPHSQAIWVIAGDTLAVDQQGIIYGKPASYHDAITLIKTLSQEPVSVITGSAIGRFEYINNQWKMTEHCSWYNSSTVLFSIPSNEIELYLKNAPEALHACGACIIEGYGSRYLEKIEGSFTGVMGLPIDQVHKNLIKLGYKP